MRNKSSPTILLLNCNSSMDFAILLISLLITALSSSLYLFIFPRIKRRQSKQRGIAPPGPRKLPLIGNLHQVGDLTHRNLWLLSQKHGPLMHLQIGHVSILVVSSSDIAREILKINDFCFCSRPMLTCSNKFSYGCKDISFAPYGDYWREVRKICILQLFSTKRVSSFQSIREAEVCLLIDSISSSLSLPINLTKFVSSLTASIICRVALSKKYDQGDQEDNLLALLKEIEILLGSFFIADYFPSLSWIDKLTGQQQRLERTFSKFESFYDELIEDHIDQNRTNTGQENIVDVLLHLQKNSPYITSTGIKAILMDILAAGIGTSSAIIIWAMAELVRNSRIMQKAQEEIRSSDNFSKCNLHQLQYLNSVVKETLRLHLPVPLLLPREAIRHCKISGYDIEPDTQVYINAWGIARDPKTWDNPEEFLPERFNDRSIDIIGHNFELIPFGSGRRSCPGMNLGMAIVEHALANLLYYFDWKLPEGMSKEEMDMDDVPGITVHKRTALCLVASRYT
ncbi:cytochrome P450 71A1 [Dendrobium catenatum]|uniref:Cytochrome P450 71A9 n=1 Tax=Dendrobium catenatum TaxID=906689 RepID=A0A2I0WKZ0_9ASPA|nr:cytochrome P450 71A1 [Dendrobium catenatum]PKU76327.1 Cytochrome P450 71A9 [Dendrobium catenatum]